MSLLIAELRRGATYSTSVFALPLSFLIVVDLLLYSHDIPIIEIMVINRRNIQLQYSKPTPIITVCASINAINWPSIENIIFFSISGNKNAHNYCYLLKIITASIYRLSCLVSCNCTWLEFPSHTAAAVTGEAALVPYLSEWMMLLRCVSMWVSRCYSTSPFVVASSSVEIEGSSREVVSVGWLLFGYFIGEIFIRK